ncbi:hypothetical protein RND71_013536 [Anisodus tanguticus]|uniref:Protein SENESCENCE-ASSOCIATED GENE 21, mitochondrial-like n=1 Tax=Anisodus tanguticus TaxID=243964 RepID=A0AAE1S9I4_9SOLA|nr:hypothetical protein RND71_013536 [Anisodus tanguticus]
MPRVPFSSVLLLNLRCRRGYTVAAESLKERTVASNIRKVTESSSSSSSSSKGVENKEIFWMRDPKTGNWIPETHFNVIDAAELRDKFLPSNRKFTMPKA